MCFKPWRSASDVQTTILNRTEDTIVIRDKNRLVWGQVRMELKPEESKRTSIKARNTYFSMGAMLKVDEITERDLKVRIDIEQLAGRNQISICKNANGEYYVQQE